MACNSIAYISYIICYIYYLRRNQMVMAHVMQCLLLCYPWSVQCLEYAHLYQARSFTTIWPAQAQPWVLRTSWKFRFLASFTPTRLINKIDLFLLTISPPPLLNENCLDNDYKTCHHPTWYEFLGTPSRMDVN